MVSFAMSTFESCSFPKNVSMKEFLAVLHDTPWNCSDSQLPFQTDLFLIRHL